MKTTDDQDELFGIVDENDQVIGQATRGEVHKNKNLIHRSIGIAIFNSKGEIFLQQRSAGKDTDPGKWTISCSGHVVSSCSLANPQYRIFQTRPVFKGFNSFGHSSLSLVKRISRSLGRSSKLILSALRKSFSWLRFTRGRSHVPQKLSIYEETAHRELQEELGVDLPISPVCKYLCRAPNETEMVMLYKAVYDGPFKLNSKEILQGKFFTRKELIRLVGLGKLEISFMGKVALEKIGWR